MGNPVLPAEQSPVYTPAVSSTLASLDYHREEDRDAAGRWLLVIAIIWLALPPLRVVVELLFAGTIWTRRDAWETLKALFWPAQSGWFLIQECMNLVELLGSMVCCIVLACLRPRPPRSWPATMVLSLGILIAASVFLNGAISILVSGREWSVAGIRRPSAMWLNVGVAGLNTLFVPLAIALLWRSRRNAKWIMAGVAGLVAVMTIVNPVSWGMIVGHWVIHRSPADWQQTGGTLFELFRILLQVATVVLICLRQWKGLAIVPVLACVGHIAWFSATIPFGGNVTNALRWIVASLHLLLHLGCAAGLWWLLAWHVQQGRSAKS